MTMPTFLRLSMVPIGIFWTLRIAPGLILPATAMVVVGTANLMAGSMKQLIFLNMLEKR